MRVLHVMAGGAHGGAEIAFVDMCIAMKEAGVEVEAVTRPNAVRVPRLQAAGVSVHCLPFGGAIDLYTPWRLRRIIARFKPDIVQSWMARAPSKMPKSNGFIHVGRMGTPYKMKYFTACDAFVAITPDLRDYIIGNGIHPDRVIHINNFAEVEPVETPLRRCDFDTPEDAVVLLGLGRLHRDKAFDVLIRAMADLPERFYCWIAGEGVLRGELEALIAELGLQKRVKLLGWRNDRAALFQAVDQCAFISRDEGFGTVFVQCWAQRVPLVASDCDGPRQYVRDGQDGLMVPQEDVQATRDAILRVADDPALQAQLVEAGYARYMNEFTKARSVEAYLAFYRRLIASRQA